MAPLRPAGRTRLLGADRHEPHPQPPRRSAAPRRPGAPTGAWARSSASSTTALGVAKGGRVFLDKIFPDHWSFMLGEIALYSFVVLLATGVFLALYFVPSATQVIYHGILRAAAGPAGLGGLRVDGQHLLRRPGRPAHPPDAPLGGRHLHRLDHRAHGPRSSSPAPSASPASSTGPSGPSCLSWPSLEGFIGYSLPDDLISGTGLRIGYSIARVDPLVGSYLASFLWGGQFPGNGSIIPRFYIIHVLIIPLVLIGLLAAHLGLLVRQKHTQFKGEGRTEHNVVGSPMFPTFMAKTTGFLFMVTGSRRCSERSPRSTPSGSSGSYDPSKISYAVQPDWYMGMARRRAAHHAVWEFTGFGHTVPLEVFLPAVLFPGFFTSGSSVPALERRITGDNELHNLLDRPRDRPKRTAAGAAMFAFLFTLFAASSTDVLANYFHVSLNAVLWSFRVATFVMPDHRGTGDLPALPRDAGRPRHRQAQAGGHRQPLGRRRVRDGTHGPSARRRARGAEPEPVPSSSTSRPSPATATYYPRARPRVCARSHARANRQPRPVGRGRIDPRRHLLRARVPRRAA